VAETRLVDYIENFTLKNEISEAIHKKLLDLLRYYIFIGGMPEAVRVFAESENMIEIERVHNSILLSLQYDFAKYGTKSQQQHLIHSLKYMGQNPGSRIKYVNIDKDTRSAFLKEAIQKIEMSRVVHLVKHSNSPGVPLSKHVKDEVYKTIFLDIGLSNSMNKVQLADPLSILTIHEGAIAEQFAGQELLALQPAFHDPVIYFWSREKKSSDAEVDFLHQHNNKVYPVEVKAGKTGKLKSLHIYLFEKKIGTGIRFNTDFPSFGEFSVAVRSGKKTGELTYKLLSLPLYLINQLPRLLDDISGQ
jgi:uncharacterized protein